MMDGIGEEEEEIRPQRGRSIRLPEDSDLEAQRYYMTASLTYSIFRSSLFSSSATRKTVRFSESNTYETPPSRTSDDYLSSTEILSQQQQIMLDQDDSLDRLSESIGRQRELSIQIGDELDSKGELLEDVDGMVDRSGSRLDGA